MCSHGSRGAKPGFADAYIIKETSHAIKKQLNVIKNHDSCSRVLIAIKTIIFTTKNYKHRYFQSGPMHIKGSSLFIISQ